MKYTLERLLPDPSSSWAVLPFALGAGLGFLVTYYWML